jgi:hypothetical protein
MTGMDGKASFEASASLISDMGIAKAIAKGGTLVLLGSLFGKGLKFVAEVVLGRNLGPDG